MKFYGQFTPSVDQFIFERYFPEIGIEGVFVECGAFDGLTDASCKFFEETMGWKGYNFEAQPWTFEQLTKNRPHSTNINLALSDQNGEALFTSAIHPDLGKNFGNGSISHQHEHLDDLNSRGCTYETYPVNTITWKNFIQEYKLTKVDLFVLDVEGHELSVLESMKECLVLPDIICIEYGHLGLNTVKEHLELLGYTYDITSNANAFFVKNEKLSLFALRSSSKKITEHKGSSDRYSEAGIDHKLIEENIFLKAHIYELTRLYNEIIGSRSWKMILILKKIVGRK